MSEVFLKKSSFTETTREPYSGDTWDRGDTSTTWEFGSASLKKPLYGNFDRFVTSFDINKGDVLFFVVAVWGDGDTFGHEAGCRSEVFGVFKTENEAKSFETRLNGPQSKDDRLYRPWFGYFNSFDGTQILERTIS